MILAQVDLSADLVVKNITLTGHAGFSLKGSDIVCAGVTVLLRTFVSLLKAEPSVVVNWKRESEGDVEFSVDSVAAHSDRYLGWCWFFLRGLEDLAKEFPQHVKLNYGHWKGRLLHGS